jgi:hypothetical protein
LNEYTHFIFKNQLARPLFHLITLKSLWFFVAFLWFCINKHMQQLSTGQRLQHAYRQHIAPYSPYVQFAVTLTLKQVAKIRVPRFDNYGDDYYEFWQKLDDSTLDSTIKHFTKKLTKAIYGNHSKHKNKQDWARPLVIVAVEGKNNYKLTHLHLAIGNIPNTHTGIFAHHAQAAFERCDFANKHMCVKPVYDGAGWLGYITKEVGYSNTNALDVVSSCIPPFIQRRICT